MGQKWNQLQVIELEQNVFSSALFSTGEQKGTIDFDQEGERITVNFDQTLQVNDSFP